MALLRLPSVFWLRQRLSLYSVSIHSLIPLFFMLHEQPGTSGASRCTHTHRPRPCPQVGISSTEVVFMTCSLCSDKIFQYINPLKGIERHQGMNHFYKSGKMTVWRVYTTFLTVFAWSHFTKTEVLHSISEEDLNWSVDATYLILLSEEVVFCDLFKVACLESVTPGFIWVACLFHRNIWP